MDNQQWNHHRHHHVYPNQGNNLTICPTCSISHFPFCPSRAPYVLPPPLDPPRNPSMTHMANFGNFGGTDRELYDPRFGNECSYVSDGNSKRLRVDGLVRDRGSEVIYDLSQCRDVGSYGKQDGFGFDGNGGVREKDGVSSVAHGSYRDEMGYRSSYGSYGGVKRSVFDGQDGLSGNRIGNVGHEFSNRYGEMVKPVDSVGSRQGGVVGYENDGLYKGYEHVNYRSSYGPMQYEQRNNVATSSHYSSSQAPIIKSMQQHGQKRFDSASPSQFNERKYSLDAGSCPVEGYQGSLGSQHMPMQSKYGPSLVENHGGYGNSLDVGSRPVEGYQGSFGNQHVLMNSKYGPPHGDNHGGYGNSLDAGSRSVERYQGSLDNQHVPMHSKYDPPHGDNHGGYGNLLDVGSRPIEGYQGSFGNQHVPMHSMYCPPHGDNLVGHGNSLDTGSRPKGSFSSQHVPMHSKFGPPHGDNHGGYVNSLGAGSHPGEGCQGSFGNQHVPMQSKYGPPHEDNHGGYGNSYSNNMGHFQAPQGVDVRPPLPPLPASPPPPPPPPLPMEPPPPVSSLFPVVASSSSAVQSSCAPIPEFHMPAQPHLPCTQVLDSSSGMMQRVHPPLSSSGHYVREDSGLSSKNRFNNKPKVLDASELFKLPHRATRPDHFVIILRGLPGSGKSYLAKMLRDLEVEHGGNAPRIHSMDDYFMTEVEKGEENETSKSSGRGKKPIMKTVLEYCYEPEMEEAYRASMLKAFKKTLDEGAFTFVIVDDRNLRVADFAQFWATAKRSGYEAYVLEAPYKDPAGCAARNVHGFVQDDVEKMAALWEEAPSLYLQLDVKSLFHGDDLAESNIQEVDMDTDDGDFEGSLPGTEEREPGKNFALSVGDVEPHDVGDNAAEVKDLGCSKWSSNLDDEDDERTEVLKGKPNVLSGLLKTYGKEGKSVHWGDQGGHTGFSIGAVKKANAVSLVIGPGAGYNMKSNPIPEHDVPTPAKSGEMRKHSVFKERLRAEQESFKAVFDRRRQRIGGVEEE